MAKVNQPHARQDYCTPPELLEAVQKRFGTISFDAACTRENAVAALGYFYPEHDALARDWRELQWQTVWCNPPFAKSRDYAEKAQASQWGGVRRDGTIYSDDMPTVLLLVPAAVDSRWYRAHVHERALVLPLSPRVAFVGQPTAINRPLMLCVYGPNVTPGFEPWQWKQPKNNKENK